MDDYFEERFFVSGIFIFSNRSQLAHGRNVVQIDVADAIVAVSTTKTLHHYLGLDMTRASFRPLGQWNQNLGSRFDSAIVQYAKLNIMSCLNMRNHWAVYGLTHTTATCEHASNANRALTNLYSQSANRVGSVLVVAAC